MQRTIYTYPQPGPSQNPIDLSPSGLSGLQSSPPGRPSRLQGSIDLATNPTKKRRVDRACDACRRRKIKCDGPKMLDNICSNCLQTKKHCTYIEDSKPRGPSKAHVTGLENRMEKLEAILKQLRPETDFTAELGPPVIRDSWKNEETSNTFQEPLYSPSSPSHPRRDSHSSPNYSATNLQRYTRSRVNSSDTGLPHFSRSTHLIFGSQPTHGSYSKPDHLQSEEDTDDDEESSSSDHSTSSLTLEIENVTGLVKKLKLRGTEDDSDHPPENNNRFHGRSSTVGLVEATRQFKLMHLLDSLESARPSRESPQGIEDLPLGSLTRRPEFWRTPKWERVWESLKTESSELFASVLAGFPPSDLAQGLINLYFIHVNAHIPLLHRPTFERQWGESLHHKNIWFAAVCLSLFAVASRFTDDLRVTGSSGEPGAGPPDWGHAGWTYFEVAIGIHRARRSLFYPASLFEIQTFTILGMFLRGTESPSAAWILVSLGIRKAQDVGAHRQNVYRNKPTVDEELWKRAIWCLIVFDRIGGAVLGRGCGVGEEDFDIALPLEVDDEYWESEDPSVAFQQPPGIPPKVGAFNLFIKLSQIVAFALKTVYALDKSKIFSGMSHSNWCKDVLDQLTAAMSDWKTLVPKHLIWSPQMQDKEFIIHAATLQTFYHFAEMLIYRPFIPLLTPTISDISPLDQTLSSDFILPAMDICIEAARSCARIAEAQIQHGISLVPMMMHVAQISAATLLIRVWDLKTQEKDHQTHGLEDIKPPFIQRIESLLTDIGVFIRVLEAAEPRWRFISTILPQLKECLPGTSNGQGTHNRIHTPTALRSRGTSNVSRSPEHFPLASQGRSPPFSQSEDQSWQWKSPVVEQSPVQLPLPITNNPVPHRSPTYVQGANPPINLKQEPSPPLHPTAQGHYRTQPHDGYFQDPGTRPSSSRETIFSHQQSRTSSFTTPLSTSNTGQSSRIPYISSSVGRTSFPSYVEDRTPTHEDHCRTGDRTRVPEDDDEGVPKISNNVNVQLNSRPTFYSYPRSVEPRSAPDRAPTSAFNSKTYRANDKEGQTWEGQHHRRLTPPDRALDGWNRSDPLLPHTQYRHRDGYPRDSAFMPN